MGIRKNIGVLTDKIAYMPTPVVNEYYKNEKVVDFDVGYNTLVLLTGKSLILKLLVNAWLTFKIKFGFIIKIYRG